MAQNTSEHWICKVRVERKERKGQEGWRTARHSLGEGGAKRQSDAGRLSPGGFSGSLACFLKEYTANGWNHKKPGCSRILSDPEGQTAMQNLEGWPSRMWPRRSKHVKVSE